MQVRIVSDGTAEGTKVINVETGEQVENVLWLTWTQVVEDGTSTALLEIKDVPCDIVTRVRKTEVEDTLYVPEAFKVQDEDWQWFKNPQETVRAEVPEDIRIQRLEALKKMIGTEK